MDSRLNECTIAPNTLIVYGAWVVGFAIMVTTIAGVLPHGSGFIGLGVLSFGHLRIQAAMLGKIQRRQAAALELAREGGRVAHLR